MEKRVSANFLVKTWKRLRRKKSREAYNNAQREIGLPFQIWAVRERRGWTQAELAQKCGWSKRRQNDIEGGGAPLTWKTLERLAAAFDVGLLVKFVPFSELVSEEKKFNATTFNAVGFEEDGINSVVLHPLGFEVGVMQDVGYRASPPEALALKVAENIAPYSAEISPFQCSYQEEQNVNRTTYEPGKCSLAEGEIGEFPRSILEYDRSRILDLGH